MVRLISGGWPAVWRVPWVQAWRLGEQPAQNNTPPVFRHLLKELYARANVPLERIPGGQQ